MEQHIQLPGELQKLGYISSLAAIDGVYGPSTREAIKTWQTTNGLEPTGLLGMTDMQRLASASTSQSMLPEDATVALDRSKERLEAAQARLAKALAGVDEEQTADVAGPGQTATAMRTQEAVSAEQTARPEQARQVEQDAQAQAEREQKVEELAQIERKRQADEAAQAERTRQVKQAAQAERVRQAQDTAISQRCTQTSDGGPIPPVTNSRPDISAYISTYQKHVDAVYEGFSVNCVQDENGMQQSDEYLLLIGVVHVFKFSNDEQFQIMFTERQKKFEAQLKSGSGNGYAATADFLEFASDMTTSMMGAMATVLHQTQTVRHCKVHFLKTEKGWILNGEATCD